MAGFHRSAMETAIALSREDIRFQWATPYNESLITRARNNIVSAFLETDLEYLFFIDADIEFTAEDVSKLWNLDADCGCGAYPLKQINAKTVVVRNGENVSIEPAVTMVGVRLPELIYRDSEPLQVDYAGCGFMMIRRNVIIEMQQKYKRLSYFDTGNRYALFDTAIHAGTYLSEDYQFCRLLKDAGFKIVLDPSINLKHWGMYPFGGN